MAAPSVRQPEAEIPGFFCSTSGTVIQDRDALANHYKSDFHRYNLKRKVAGLPPVTKEWFDTRRAQLVRSQALASPGVPPGHVKVWYDPLLRKTFRSEQTYLAHTKSNKYQEAVRKSGRPVPAAIISVRKVAEGDERTGDKNENAASSLEPLPSTTGFHVVRPSGGLPLRMEDGERWGTFIGQSAVLHPPVDQRADASSDEDDDEGSGWETASDEDIDTFTCLTAGQSHGPLGDGVLGEWNVCQSLFDNHISSSFKANLEYMSRTFGFYLHDTEYLHDPKGLVQYLGAKLQQGRVPLYSRGDDSTARQFRSLHAVQRHMIDSGRCKMLYEGNEEEYADFYDYGEEKERSTDGEEDRGKQLGLSSDEPAMVYGYELLVPAAGRSSYKVLGTREFARYYKQQHQGLRRMSHGFKLFRRDRQRGHDIIGMLMGRAVPFKPLTKSRRDQKWEGKREEGLFMRGNVIRNLPKNVPY